jgi:hypothetical protein
MRRIKIIAGKVLGNSSYRTACIPSRYENSRVGWPPNRTGINRVLREYLKILWFMVYINFT